MKKLIVILVYFFMLVSFVHAKELVSEDLSYYVKISKSGSEKQFINVKKIYDKETLNVVFNTNPNHYNVNNKFKIFEDYSYENWHIPDSLINLFNTIVYYGYINNPSDINYFITQIMVWKDVFNYKVDIVDEFGNLIDNYDDIYKNIHSKILLHNTQSPFFYQNHNYEIWTTNNFKYMPNTIILDNPIIDGVDINSKENNITIYNEKVGNYTLNFSKEYNHETYSYTDGINFYLQSLGGPSNICYKTKYNIYGTKINLEENLIGVNGRFGDAILESKYELYLDDELKLIVDDISFIYVKSNSNYILKDISNNLGINNSDDINFNVLNDEYFLKIDKYVISKNISLNIENDKKYYVFLKSNKELYEILDNKKDLITLPFGTYYITDENGSYYEEIYVNDSIDEVLTIENEIKEEMSEDNNVIIEEEMKENENPKIDVVNPETLDNINIYKFIFLCSSSLLWIFISVLRLIV